MMLNNEDLREANVALAQSIFQNFNPHDAAWQENLADDVAMVFPYAASIGLPPRVEGKEAAIDLFKGVADALALSFHDVSAQALADPEWVVVEQRGQGAFKDNPYNQQYVIFVQFRDGKLRHYREYFDCKVVTDCFGSVENLMAG
jgi:ketosteroid isomerase-like protein